MENGNEVRNTNADKWRTNNGLNDSSDEDAESPVKKPKLVHDNSMLEKSSLQILDEQNSNQAQEESTSNANSLHKCERNVSLIEDILLLEDLPKYWSREFDHNLLSSSPFKLIEVGKECEEYHEVVNALKSLKYEITLKSIKRIENPLLWAQYLCKVQKMANSEPPERMKLFHGTRLENIDSICRNNFDWRRVKNYKYGRGVNFARGALYADYYTEKPHGVILWCEVLKGKTILGDCNTIIPKDNADTTHNHDDERRGVYVKYEDDDFYPLYIIEYNSILRN